VKPEIVKTEHLELIRYNEVSGTRRRTADVNRSNLLSKLAEFKDPSVYRPFIFIMFYFLVSDIVGSVPWRPYTSKIMTEVGISNNQSLLLVNIGTTDVYIHFYRYNNNYMFIKIFSGSFCCTSKYWIPDSSIDRPLSGEKVFD